MFKGFSNTRRNNAFNGFPGLNFNMSNQAFGLGSVKYWFDPVTNISTTTDLANISFWKDKVNNLEVFQTTAGNQPTYKSSYFNGYPAVYFPDGRYFNFRVTTATPKTIAFIAVSLSPATYNHVMNDQSGGSLERLVMGGNGSVNVTGIGCYNNTTALINSTVEDASNHIVVISRTCLIVDGVNVGSGTWSYFRGAYDRMSNVSGFSLNGYLGELIFYDTEITSDRAILLSDTMNLKYAVY